MGQRRQRARAEIVSDRASRDLCFAVAPNGHSLYLRGPTYSDTLDWHFTAMLPLLWEHLNEMPRGVAEEPFAFCLCTLFCQARAPLFVRRERWSESVALAWRAPRHDGWHDQRGRCSLEERPCFRFRSTCVVFAEHNGCTSIRRVQARCRGWEYTPLPARSTDAEILSVSSATHGGRSGCGSQAWLTAGSAASHQRC